MNIPEPVITYRSWTIVYTRPRRMGWPNLARTGYPAIERKPSQIMPRKIIIQVRWYSGDEEPHVDSITVSGTWAGTTLAVNREKIRFGETRPGLALTIYSPDWVDELAADALQQARKELAGA